MAGHRDDGTFAEDRAHHPNRKVSREQQDDRWDLEKFYEEKSRVPKHLRTYDNDETDEETEHGDYYERQTSNDARRD